MNVFVIIFNILHIYIYRQPKITFLSLLSEAVEEGEDDTNKTLTTFLSNGGDAVLFDFFSIDAKEKTLGESKGLCLTVFNILL